MKYDVNLEFDLRKISIKNKDKVKYFVDTIAERIHQRKSHTRKMSKEVLQIQGK